MIITCFRILTVMELNCIGKSLCVFMMIIIFILCLNIISVFIYQLMHFSYRRPEWGSSCSVSCCTKAPFITETMSEWVFQCNFIVGFHCSQRMIKFILVHYYILCVFYQSMSVHLVTLQDLHPVLNTLNSSGDPMIRLSHEDVQKSLEQLFRNNSKDLSSQAVPEATDQTTRLLFKLFDRWGDGNWFNMMCIC